MGHLVGPMAAGIEREWSGSGRESVIMDIEVLMPLRRAYFVVSFFALFLSSIYPILSSSTLRIFNHFFVETIVKKESRVASKNKEVSL